MALLVIHESMLATLSDPVTFVNAGALPDGDEFANDGSVMLFISVATSPRTVTVHGVRSCDFGVVHDIAVLLGAAGGYILPPVSPYFLNENGRVRVTFDDPAGVQLLAFRSRDIRR